MQRVRHASPGLEVWKLAECRLRFALQSCPASNAALFAACMHAPLCCRALMASLLGGSVAQHDKGSLGACRMRSAQLPRSHGCNAADFIGSSLAAACLHACMHQP